MIDSLRAFVHSSGPWLVGAISLAAVLASLTLLVAAIVAFPPDYFAEDKAPSTLHPAARVLLRIAKNLLGFLFVVLGVILSVPGVPGQGFLTIFVGLLMMDLPKKRALERKLLKNARLLTFLNAIRSKFHRPPLELPHV